MKEGEGREEREGRKDDEKGNALRKRGRRKEEKKRGR